MAASVKLREYGAAIALGAAILGCYAYCLSSNVASWDTAEMQTVPYILGIPHPTGFPVFVLIGWLFTHALPVSSVAWRMNLLSATCITVSAVGIMQSARTLGANRLASVLGALIFACIPISINKATHTDVHAMVTMWFTLLLFCLLRYISADGPRYLCAAWFFEGLAIATHLTAVWSIPALIVAMAYRRPTLRTAAASLGLLVLAGLTYAYLPLSSLFVHDPNAALVLPAGISAFYNTNNPHVWSGFLREALGLYGGAGSTLGSLVDPRQYPAYFEYWLAASIDQFGAPELLVAALLFVHLLRARPRSAILLLVAGFASVPFAVAYAPFEGDVTRYLMPSFVACAIVLAIGISYLPGRLTRYCFIAVQACTLVLLVRDNWRPAVNERTDTGGVQSIDAVRNDTPSNAIIISVWPDVPSLAYAKYVDHDLGDRYVVAAWPGDLLDNYSKLSEIAPVYVFLPTADESAMRVVPQRLVTSLPTTAPGHSLFKISARH